ncbi:MAG TPA: carboxypeptidase-like regulatory domain-containing protein, partial [Candidatus Ozemobacteraceae bacterium]|nr:carboxypeptidase-like regulatory domain-containing protein [Candidatus Ozemobacteraceae bacterium]
MNAGSGAFSRFRILLGLVIAVCVSALIGVGCGGGSSVSSSNILNTLSGRVLDESAPASVRAAGTLVGVPGAQVWIEDLAADAQFWTVSGPNGEYAFHGVPEGPHRVVARFTDASGVKKTRSYPVSVPIGAETTVVESLVLEPAKNYVTGILRDTSGAYLPYGTVLRLWGEAFAVGLNGAFTSPPLPGGIYEEIILVQTGPAGQVAVITAPFVSGVMPAFVDLRIDMAGTASNHPPSGTLIARNASGIA